MDEATVGPATGRRGLLRRAAEQLHPSRDGNERTAAVADGRAGRSSDGRRRRISAAQTADALADGRRTAALDGLRDGRR